MYSFLLVKNEFSTKVEPIVFLGKETVTSVLAGYLILGFALVISVP